MLMDVVLQLHPERVVDMPLSHRISVEFKHPSGSFTVSAVVFDPREALFEAGAKGHEIVALQDVFGTLVVGGVVGGAVASSVPVPLLKFIEESFSL